jgi:hypothetical protein
MWNWKSAALSMILRGPIFLIASMRRGWEVAAAALLTEAVFCAITAGFYGTLVQAVRNARPKWLTGILITFVMPAGFQGLEYGMHLLRGTPHLKAAEIASIITSALSALFNWYAMRRGALLVGGEGGNFGGDMKRMPWLIATFVAEPFVWVWRRIKQSQSSQVISVIPSAGGERVAEDTALHECMARNFGWDRNFLSGADGRGGAQGPRNATGGAG